MIFEIQLCGHVLHYMYLDVLFTVMILSFRTDSSGQKGQTLFAISICIFLTKYPKIWPFFLNFR